MRTNSSKPFAKLYVEHYKGLEAYKRPTNLPCVWMEPWVIIALFKENNIDSETANRFGVWLTGVLAFC